MNRIINVAVDGVCILFSLLIFIYLRMSTDRKEQLNKLFSWICMLNIGMLLGDIPNWIFEGFAKPWYPAALQLGTFLLYLSGCVIPWVYSLYVYRYLSQKTAVKKQIKTTLHWMFVIDALLLLLNFYNNMYYSIDSENIYHRGPLFVLSQAIPIVFLLFDLAVMICYRRVLRAKEFAAFLSYLMLPVIGIVIQTYSYGVAFTYLASSISIFIIFLCIQSEQRLQSEQQKRDLDKANLRIMLSQIQPHFLYNALTGIKTLCGSAPARAEEAMEHFAYFLRSNLDSLSDIRLIPFDKEIGHVKDYFYLEKMRFQDRVNLVLELEHRDFLLPSMTLQPLVENAVRYGITKKPNGGTITIRSREQDGQIIITIMDDGVGFATDAPKEDGRSHTGIENVRSRLRLQSGGSLQIQSEIGVGTEVRITLPGKEGIT